MLSRGLVVEFVGDGGDVAGGELLECGREGFDEARFVVGWFAGLFLLGLRLCFRGLGCCKLVVAVVEEPVEGGAWFGVGAVFSDYGNLGKENFLPNFGVGLRVELKHNLNGRIDYGMGKTTGGFVFSIGEAF